MNLDLVSYLCDPADGSDLELTDYKVAVDGIVDSGWLIGRSGKKYPIVNGVPRFVERGDLSASVEAFGDEWNFFNYDMFKVNWLKHLVNGVFGSRAYFAGKTIVDCGAGSGMQSKWMAEYGASRVIALELSHSVDGVMKKNLTGLKNVDVVQCSIDQPPIKANSILDLVICHNVVQHTPSVENTVNRLWKIVGSGGELVFNCYLRHPNDPVWMARWILIYKPLRAILSRCSFKTILAYAKFLARLRGVPIVGTLLEKAQIVVRGDVPPGDRYEERLYATAVLNTFDWYGAHKYQHQLTAQELSDICGRLSPPYRKISNLDAYFRRDLPPGLPLRLLKP